MMIPVMYKDGKMGYADQYQLDRLINTRQIIKFRRADEWVIIGFDPMRISDSGYQGAERRKKYSASGQ